MSGRLDFSFQLGSAPSRPHRRPVQAPFRIVLIGDFSGRPAGARERRLVPVDADSLDARCASLQPRSELVFGADRTELVCTQLDDFHPDALLRRVPALAAVHEQVKALRDPARAAAVLAALGTKSPKPGAAQPPAAAATAAANDGASPFERLLGARRDPERPAAAGLEPWLEALVRPHLVPAVDPRATDLAATLQQALADLLRDVLHHPTFQAREAAWRGAHWLLQHVEADEDVPVHLLDASETELAATGDAADVRSSSLHALLCDRAGAGGAPIAAAVLLPPVLPTEAGLRTLAALGACGELGGFPVLATASARLFGAPSWSEAGDPAGWQLPADITDAWQALRSCPQARRIALLAPRFLLRLPYGNATDPIDAFRFEELPAAASHEHYLWGAPGLAVARVLAAAFRVDGWQLDIGGHHDIVGLPLHTWKADGAVRMQPCAETLLTERGVAALMAAGVSVLQSHANRDAARLVRLRSLAAGDVELVGPWSR